MNHWLVKSEPETYSWSDLVRDKRTDWTGVRNYAARLHLRAMQVGDLVFVYHSGDDKSVVGIVKVVNEAHADSTDDTGQWECVDVAAVTDLPKPVTLAEIKANPKLAGMVLVRNSRLSVQPVSPTEWSMICKLGGLAKPPQA